MTKKPKTKKQVSDKSGQLKKRAVRKRPDIFQIAFLLEQALRILEIEKAEEETGPVVDCQRIKRLESNCKVRKDNLTVIQNNQADAIEKLKSELESAKSGIGELCEKIKKTNERIDKFQEVHNENVDEYNQNFRNTKTAIDKLQSDNKRLEDELASLKSEIADLKKTYGIYRTVNEINPQAPAPVQGGRLTVVIKAAS